MDTALRVHVEAQLPRAQGKGLCDGRRERCSAQTHGRDPQSQMVHRGVGHNGHVAHLVGHYSPPSIQKLETRVYAPAHRGGELRALLLLECLGHPGNDVLSVAHLGILDSLVVDQCAAAEIEQVRDDLRCADIDSYSIEHGHAVPRIDGDHPPAVNDRDQVPVRLSRDV